MSSHGVFQMSGQSIFISVFYNDNCLKITFLQQKVFCFELMFCFCDLIFIPAAPKEIYRKQKYIIFYFSCRVAMLYKTLKN